MDFIQIIYCPLGPGALGWSRLKKLSPSQQTPPLLFLSHFLSRRPPGYDAPPQHPPRPWCGETAPESFPGCELPKLQNTSKLQTPPPTLQKLPLQTAAPRTACRPKKANTQRRRRRLVSGW
jgi:hypothetical protein